jgi:hypothetical protein
MAIGSTPALQGRGLRRTSGEPLAEVLSVVRVLEAPNDPMLTGEDVPPNAAPMLDELSPGRSDIDPKLVFRASGIETGEFDAGGGLETVLGLDLFEERSELLHDGADGRVHVGI